LVPVTEPTMHGDGMKHSAALSNCAKSAGEKFCGRHSKSSGAILCITEGFYK
jgi:hypothetical protein